MKEGSGPVPGIVSGNSCVAHARPIRPGSFLEAETNFLLVYRIVYRSGDLAPIINDSLFDQGTDSATVGFVKELNNV